MCGGLAPASDADQETQEIINKVRAEFEGKVGQNFGEFTAVKVSRQVVAGTNFFVKVGTGSDKYIHLRVFRPLPHQGDTPQLHSYQLDKTLEDALEHFE